MKFTKTLDGMDQNKVNELQEKLTTVFIGLGLRDSNSQVFSYLKGGDEKKQYLLAKLHYLTKDATKISVDGDKVFWNADFLDQSNPKVIREEVDALKHTETLPDPDPNKVIDANLKPAELSGKDAYLFCVKACQELLAQAENNQDVSELDRLLGEFGVDLSLFCGRSFIAIDKIVALDLDEKTKFLTQINQSIDNLNKKFPV